MASGDDPRLIPFGTLPHGWPTTLDTERYESQGTSGGLAPDPLAYSKHFDELMNAGKRGEFDKKLTGLKGRLADFEKKESTALSQMNKIRKSLLTMAMNETNAKIRRLDEKIALKAAQRKRAWERGLASSNA